MKKEKKTVQVAIGIIIKNGQFLIARRMENVHLGGVWEFPGGKRLDHEKLKECLQREIKEEVGVEVKVHRKIKCFTHQYSIGKISLHPYLCSIKTGIPKPMGCKEIRWVTPSHFKSFTFPPANDLLIKELEKNSLRIN
ncbi:MAG TPA: (deoxy)nucleoside triphosphate pyrophosphohydrolase [Nitrospiria bacterium]